MNTPEARYHTKNRIVAVDIVRIMAAMLVMYEHLHRFGGISTKYITCISSILSALSPVFFVLAGYFACRNITWKKSFNNAWWSFAPFILWNTLCIIYLTITSSLPKEYNILTLYGIQSFIFDNWALFPELGMSGYPANGPLWFMRDLIFLFLLAPILAKCARFVFPVFIIASLFFDSACIYGQTLSINSLACFSGGCFLQTLSKEQQRKALTFYSPVFIIAYITVMCIDFATIKFFTHSPQWHTCKSLLSIIVYYQIARWIEVRIPIATPIALKYAPVTFLTFAAHMIIFRILHALCSRYAPIIINTDLILLFPLFTFAAMACFFFTLKHWCPSMLHLVAHYKLRPDDLKAKS